MLDLSDLIGIPFVDRGRSLMGADCWGLVRLVYEKLDIHLPLHPIPAHDHIRIDAMVQAYKPQWQRLEKPQAPCVIAFCLDHDRPELVTHTGVYIGGDRFLHARTKTGSAIERIGHPYWSRHIEGFYQWIM